MLALKVEIQFTQAGVLLWTAQILLLKASWTDPSPKHRKSSMALSTGFSYITTVMRYTTILLSLLSTNHFGLLTSFPHLDHSLELTYVGFKGTNLIYSNKYLSQNCPNFNNRRTSNAPEVIDGLLTGSHGAGVSIRPSSFISQLPTSHSGLFFSPRIVSVMIRLPTYGKPYWSALIGLFELDYNTSFVWVSWTGNVQANADYSFSWKRIFVQK